ncbi:MAG: EAL domain-containing protein [gamma proteobacterium symbiont of Taylorina sp.]|nr:EAL domain-containing protein [gamma proteobacterium symbiont of Taylorina sp.]
MKINSEIQQLNNDTILIIIIWSGIIVSSLFWNFEREHNQVLKLAEVEAQTNLKKDLAFRRWATKMGGLYVRVTADSQPSPFMSHMPERDLISTSGQLLTLYNPAIMLRLIMETQDKLYGVKASITSTEYLNPDNAPDHWEKEALKIVSKTLRDYSNISEIDDQPVLRYMQPMIIEKGCLKCHAWDTNRIGKVGGATNVAISLIPFYILEQEARRVLLISHGGIWILGVGFVGFFIYRRKTYLKQLQRQQNSLYHVNRSLQHEVDERNKAELQLRLTSTVFEHTSEGIIITDANALIIDCNQAFTDISGYSLSEVKGKNPSIANSGRHNKIFFKSMWQSIIQSGQWAGEIWDRRKNGEIYPKWLSINSVLNTEGKISHYIGVFTDISHIKETEKKLEHLAFKDSLTNLPNRQLFYDRFELELKRANRLENKRVALLFIDLDQFKHINDTHGHHIGDELLQVIAQRLETCVRDKDTVARLGGDEFTVILSDIDSSAVATDIAVKIINRVSLPINLHHHELFIGASIGISIYPEDSTDREILIRNADAAMYYAKENGRGNFQFFNEAINLRNQKRSQLEADLRRAIKEEEFELYFQPQINILTEEIIGAEVLIRWNDPKKGLISPLDFIPIAEENGMIIEIGEWVFKQTCRYLHNCIAQGKHPVPIAINLSAVQFSDEGLIDMIESVLEQENLSTQWIELEITESAIMENADKAIGILDKLSTLGIRISIDDFGTGYSSLAYLKKFTVDKLKIDREFIKNLPDDKEDVVLTSTMIILAKNLGLDVLAEGVETKEQVYFLKQHGCNLIQGYYYSKPLPEAEFKEYVDAFSDTFQQT